jgi:hypothetical protein
MSRMVIMAAMCVLLALNLVVSVMNSSAPSRAAVAGMTFSSLTSDPDFVKAVKAIAGTCKVNVDTARVEC